MAIFLAFLAALCWAGSGVLARLGLQAMRPATGTFISLVGGLALTAVATLAFNFQQLVHVPPRAIPWLIFIGLTNYGVGRVLNFTGVQLAGASRASVVIATVPLFSTAFAMAFGGERPSIVTLLGTLAIVGGIILIVSEGNRGALAASRAAQTSVTAR